MWSLLGVGVVRRGVRAVDRLLPGARAVLRPIFAGALARRVFTAAGGGAAVGAHAVRSDPRGPDPLRDHRAAGGRPDQRLLDRPLLPAPRLHERHGVGEEGQLRELPVQPRRPSTPSSATGPASSTCSCSAAVGALLAIVYRAGGAASSGWPWASSPPSPSSTCPQGRLWNARLLPFYYLAVYLLGAIGCGRAGAHRSPASSRPTSGDRCDPCSGSRPSPALGGWLVVLPLPPAHAAGERPTTRRRRQWYTWGPLPTKDSSFINGWAKWNFTGYEGKPAYPEYYAITQTMAGLGPDQRLRSGHVGARGASTTGTARRWR